MKTAGGPDLELGKRWTWKWLCNQRWQSGPAQRPWRWSISVAVQELWPRPPGEIRPPPPSHWATWPPNSAQPDPAGLKRTVNKWECTQKSKSLKVLERQTFSPRGWRVNSRCLSFLLPQGHFVEMSPRGLGIRATVNQWPPCLTADATWPTQWGPWHHPSHLPRQQVIYKIREIPGAGPHQEVQRLISPFWFSTKPSFTGRSYGSKPPLPWKTYYDWIRSGMTVLLPQQSKLRVQEDVFWAIKLSVYLH